MIYPKGKHPNSRNGFKKGHSVPEKWRQISRENNLRTGNKPPSRKGVKLSETEKKKLSKIAKEKGFGKWMTGKKLSIKTREKCRSSQVKRVKEGRSNLYRGGKDSTWQGGKTKETLRIRNSPEYKMWRLAVYERDNFTCQDCGQRGGKLNADHIKAFCDYPKLRFKLSNGRTLCHDCHRKTDTYGHNSKLKK